MKTILVVFFVCFIIFSFLQKEKVRFLPWVLTAISSFAIYFVIFPEHANYVANHLGVGRGARLPFVSLVCNQCPDDLLHLYQAKSES